MEAVETAAVVGPHTNSLTITKTYADNSTVTYAYTPDNLPLRTTYASGRWKENVYDAQRRLCGAIYSSPNMDYELQLDEYGRTVFASNGVAQTGYALNAAGMVTNEMRITENSIDRITRAYDEVDRLTGIVITEQGYAQYLAYSTNGLLASISNSDVVIAYDYSPDLKDVGYTMAFADGGTFASEAVLDPYRRDLVLSVTNSCGGNTHTLEYSYDALSRPISRNADTFGYNARSEVSSANIGGNSETHEYDDIGNATFAAFNFATNIYTANNLNQYTSILCDSATLREPAHDVDGNLTFDGVFSYAYDADNRLASVSSNELVLVTNQYDHKGRRVRKTTPTSETTFLYDGWNLIYEREIAGTVTNETYYYWGKDISGSLQGAGGVGGLLYLKRNGTIYIPHRDANGNIVRYTDTVGDVVAEYTYGAFGNTLSATGTFADVFHFRFSTKYYDVETGLYYYGYRFYSPVLMRWLNRDPMEEHGGIMLYVFCANNAAVKFDAFGLYELTLVSDNTTDTDVLMWYLHGSVGNVIHGNIHSQNQLVEEIRSENSKHGSVVTVLNISGHGLLSGSGVLFADNTEFDVGRSYNSLKPFLARNAIIRIWSCEAASTYKKCSGLQTAANALDVTIYANTGEVMSGPDGSAIGRLSRRVVAWIMGDEPGEWKIFTPSPKIGSKGFMPGPQAFKILKEERPLND